ncbi:MAG: ornithine carbamoyltransferase [Clostridia bacterium]|nr:ornithine carbamoyltransferase [Clostridia bacterium]
MDINRYSPSYGISRKHMIDIAGFSTEEIFEFLYATKAVKAKFAAHEDTRILQGVTVALLFGDTSLRTRSALEIGIRQLGGVCVNLPYSENDMRAGENVKDIVNVISRYGVGALVTRGIEQKELEEFCAVSEISIINSTNESGIPLQTLCDLFTIWEKRGKLEGLKIAYVGKGAANAASLITGAIKCGMEVSVATPAEFAIKKSLLDNARQYGSLTVTENPAEAVRGADIIYTDSYNYHSSASDEEKKILLPYQVNNSLMSFAAHNALFMHSLPAKRGVEVTADIIDGKNSIVLEQGENKLHTIKSVLALLIK